jgi:hypothetical protein
MNLVLTVVTTKITDLWDATPYSMLVVYPGICYFHLQGKRINLLSSGM